jgi:predicted transcriptional regulator of viral defense system
MLDWGPLRELAGSQEGLFHLHDALGLGISERALSEASQVERVDGFRGVHRFRHVPVGRWHLYLTAFVWSRGEGVISHGSALDVWGLSDWLPHRAELTLPLRWKRRKVPSQVLAFFAQLPDQDVQWADNFRITTARRTVDDFIAWGIRPDLARQAVDQATRRSRPGGVLFRRSELANLHMLAR